MDLTHLFEHIFLRGLILGTAYFIAVPKYASVQRWFENALSMEKFFTTINESIVKATYKLSERIRIVQTGKNNINLALFVLGIIAICVGFVLTF